jgi:hypothetical protein
MNYATDKMVSKVFGFAAAVVMTVAVNGSLLLGVDDMARRAMPAPDLMASADTPVVQRAPAQVTLPAVTIHARKA